jgi:hypothetical protein
MPAQGKYAPALLARAEAGELTRSNTRKGTPQRQAVDRVTYLRRKQARPDVSAREALGGRPTRPRVVGLSDEDRLLIAEGEGRENPKELKAFQKFRKSKNFPSWIPKDSADMDDQTAAILVGLPKALNQTDVLGRRNGWRDTTFATMEDGKVEVTVTPIRGDDFTFILPDQDSAAQLLTVIRKANYKGLTVDRSRYGSTILAAREEEKNKTKKKGEPSPRKKTKK